MKKADCWAGVIIVNMIFIDQIQIVSGTGSVHRGLMDTNSLHPLLIGNTGPNGVEVDSKRRMDEIAGAGYAAH